MFFVLGGIVILLVSFIIALFSMVRERGKYRAHEEIQKVHQAEVVEPSFSQNPPADVNALSVTDEKPDNNIRTEPFPWETKSVVNQETTVQPSPKAEILHPKRTPTIGFGLRPRLSNSVSISDLRKH